MGLNGKKKRGVGNRLSKVVEALEDWGGLLALRRVKAKKVVGEKEIQGGVVRRGTIRG